MSNLGPATTVSQNTQAQYALSNSYPFNSVVVPAGSTDIEIQAAINKISDIGGGTVYLNAGIHSINSPIVPASNVAIIGIPTAFLTQNQLPSNDWIPSGGTILVAGLATQGMILNATDIVGTTSWPTGQASGIVIENICFSGFTGNGIKFGAQNACGLVQSRLRRLAFYKCGSGTKSTNYSAYTFAMELRNFSTINVNEIYMSACPAGLLAQCSTTFSVQTGDSWFNDINIDSTVNTGSNGNFVRHLVVGSDPNLALTQPLNFCHFKKVECIAFAGRLKLSDTATFAGGTTFTVADGTQFPIGMPVQFTAGSGNIGAVWTYFITARTGNTLSIALSRAGANVTLPGSGTLTITTTGYPIIDLGGLITTNSMTSCTFSEIAGAPGGSVGGANVYMENCANNIVNIGQAIVLAGTPTLLMRSNLVTYVQTTSDLIPDIDGTSTGQLFFFGQHRTGLRFGNSFSGTFYDSTNNMPGYNMSGAAYGSTPAIAGSKTLPDLYLSGPNLAEQIYPNRPIGTRLSGSLTVTSSIAYPQLPGLYSLEQGTTQTYTLPALQTGTVNSSSIGQTYIFHNVGAGAAIIKPSANAGGQLINNATLTNNQVSLAAISSGVAQYATFVACVMADKTTTYWALQTTGTIS